MVDDVKWCSSSSLKWTSSKKLTASGVFTLAGTTGLHAVVPRFPDFGTGIRRSGGALFLYYRARPVLPQVTKAGSTALVRYYRGFKTLVLAFAGVVVRSSGTTGRGLVVPLGLP